MSTTIREHGPQLRGTEGTRSRAAFALRSAESQLQLVCASESSLQEDGDQLQSDKSQLEEQGQLEDQRVGLTCDILYRASKTNHNLRENIREARSQHDEDLADLRFEHSRLQA